MCAAIHAAEQFFPLVHRFRLPPTALRFAAAIRESERIGRGAAKSKVALSILCCELEVYSGVLLFLSLSEFQGVFRLFGVFGGHISAHLFSKRYSQFCHSRTQA